MIVVDTSVFVNSLLEKDDERIRKSKEFLKSIEGLAIVIPRIFLLEFISIARRFGISLSRKDVEELVADFEVLSENFVFDEAFKIAELVHPRAVDSYFIAAAKLTNSVLISCDRIMVENGRKYGIKTYYLLEELDDAMKAVRKLKKEAL
jgi:hypothetical protein